MIYKPILKLHIITFERIVKATDEEDAESVFRTFLEFGEGYKDANTAECQ